jgi:hypothetical protein
LSRRAAVARGPPSCASASIAATAITGSLPRTDWINVSVASSVPPHANASTMNLRSFGSTSDSDNTNTRAAAAPKRRSTSRAALRSPTFKP